MRRTLVGLFMAVVLALAVVTAHADTVLWGDADSNGEVNMGDIIKQERCIMGLDADCGSGADANADGELDMGDVIGTILIILAQP